MLNLFKERVLEVLKAKGISMRELTSNPLIYKKACTLAYKSIPIPWRWFIGKKKVHRFVDMVKNKIVS